MSGDEAIRAAPRPNLYVPSEPFWEGAQDGKLVLQYCPVSGRFQHFPRPLSLYTGKRNLLWREVSGRGTIYSYTVVRPSSLGADSRLPPVLALVDLEEGVRVLAKVLNARPENVRIGARVVLAWDEIADGVRYPAFELAAEKQ